MQIRLGLTARATIDLDMLFRGGAWDWLNHFDNALSTCEWQGFTARRKNTPTEINVAGAHYKPLRFDVQLSYGGRSFSTVRMELAFDASPTVLHDIVEGVDLGWFGLNTLQVPCLSIPIQMAQKLHACTDPYDDGEGRENDRARDIADLWLLETLLQPRDLAKVRAATITTFTQRANARPPTATANDTWRRDYPKIAAEVTGAPPTIEDAVTSLNHLITQVDQAQ